MESKHKAVMDATSRRMVFARRRVDELLHEIRDWRRQYPYDLHPELDDDSLGWKLVLTLGAEAPLDDWALQFGEIANHLRSSLNTVLTRIVQAEGYVSENPGRLQFPCLHEKSEWKAWRKNRLEGVPDRVARVILAIQPFMQQRLFPGSTTHNQWLAVLVWLDNQEKHRIEHSVRLSSMSLEADFTPSFAAPRKRRERAIVKHDVPLEDGAIVLSERTDPDQIVLLEGETTWSADLLMKDIEDKLFDIHDEAQMLMNMTALLMTEILMVWTGEIREEAYPEVDAVDHHPFPPVGSAFRRKPPEPPNPPGRPFTLYAPDERKGCP